MKKYQKLLNVLYFILVLFVILLIFMLVDKHVVNDDEIILNACSNLNLQDTSECLVTYISKGNCQDYTNFYERLFDKLDINNMRIIFDAGSERVGKIFVLKGHTFLIAYDNSGYCLLDQEHIDCVRYGVN